MKLEKKYFSLSNIINKHNTASVLAMESCLNLLSIANKVNGECAKRITKYRFIVLILLTEKHFLSPQALTNVYGVTKPILISLISALVDEILVIKCDCLADRPKIDILLTNQNNDLVNKLFQEYPTWITNTTNKLTDS